MADNNGGGGEERSRGTVKWFNGWKGFGFITPDAENFEDLFVHQTSINFDGYRTLYDGQRVEFDVEIGDDGRSRAANVDVILRSGGGNNRGGGRSTVECYNCGRFGHFARDCYQGGDDGGGEGYERGRGGGYGGRRGGGGRRGRGGFYRGGRDGGGGGGRGRGRGRGGCYNCGDENHFARDCSNPQN